MKKVLDLLERHVQWVALGLGALYVLWMAYTYVILPPVSVKIGQETMSPGAVDPMIERSLVSELTSKMNETRVPAMTAPQYVELFRKELSYEGQPALAGVFPNPMFPQVGANEKIEVDPLQRRRPGATAVATVTELVKPPAVQMLEFRVGNSHVSLAAPKPEQPNQQNPAVARGQDGFEPRSGGQEGPLPPQPPAGQPEPAVPVALEAGVDKNWVTVKYQVSMGEMAKAFQEAKLPPDLYKTMFLDATLIRQEKKPDGSWGAETPIKRLTINQLPPMPPEKSKVRDFENYLAWANAHPTEILQPAFFTVLKGDQWAVPGEELVAAPVQPQPGNNDRPFNPADWVNATLDEMNKAGLTNQQKQQIAKYKADKKKEEQKGKGRGSGPGGKGGRGGGGAGGGGGMGGGGAFGPGDGGRGGSTAGEGLPPSDLPPPFHPPGAMGGTEGGYPPYPGPAEQAPKVTVVYPLPNPGEFDPRQPAAPEIVGWAHDDTAEPGRVYRYRVVYKLKSPIWDKRDVAKDPKLAETFALISRDGDWTGEVEVPSLTSFFVLNTQAEKGAAKVAVFRSQGGVLQKKEFEVSPGDVIGNLDAETAVDYTTGWTMVDARTDLRTATVYVILMDQDGNLHRRDWKADTASPEYQKAQQQVAGAPAAPDPRVATGRAGGQER